MFEHTEAKLKAHLADVLPGHPVHGTFDEPDLVSAGAPDLAVQVVWLGAAVSDRSRRAVKLAHRWAIYLYVGPGRGGADLTADASAAFGIALSRLLTFEPDRLTFADLENIPAPAYDGPALRLALFFTLSDVARAT
ncbi:hypothetical protein [Thauera propionica]|uniref:hypothetical protein n=1 Tax=Thauera propionica TaxID=2019431 RepID=UPI0023F26EC1|nr:hypothetical protein [Thauera propionica]MDD3674989.1 hypothetical protein [Thauera propionica]